MSRTECGIVAPNDVKEAIQLDDHNGNALWVEVIAKEMGGLDILKCF